ncbi:MAG: hypothetical protein WD077_14300 [Bacteroidia bacterium]
MIDAMRKIMWFTLLTALIPHSLLSQNQGQTIEDPFYYQVAGLVYVKIFDPVLRSKTPTVKIPKEPLKFKIVGKEIEPSDNSVFYVIKFLPIKDETGAISALKGSSNYVNSSDNHVFFWINENELNRYVENGFIVKSYKAPNARLTYGANLSLPFKLRPKLSDHNIKITPDLTLGGYIGIKYRLSHTEPYYLSFPLVTLGLATLSITDENNPASPNKGDGTVLGITASWGGVFQFDDFQFGLMMGWDRAAGEIGSAWIYNDIPWYSFSIGYSFIGRASDKSSE